jgi:hypothetical protein
MVYPPSGRVLQHSQLVDDGINFQAMNRAQQGRAVYDIGDHLLGTNGM